VHYSVKANPAPEIVRCLQRLGASFDVTSRSEIGLCLRLGVPPARLAYGSTVKKAADIAWSWRRGIRTFAFDSLPELEKIARHAPGSMVIARLAVDNAGAAWPLDRKFGCAPEAAVDLLRRADAAGLRPCGLSFHVGSQQTDPVSWDRAAAVAASVAEGLAACGLPIKSLNVGGGLPVQYHDGIPDLEECARVIRSAVTRHFGTAPALEIEPGRYLVAAAGVIESEVVLVTRKGPAAERRWVFLDIGRFGGLAETEGDAIRYPITARGMDEPCGPVVLAGPTCDSADILYEAAEYRLPLGLAAGDRVRIRCAGAYTSVYASRFNGFPALRSHFVGPGR
jgi:ornithine decarboxylase